jgi:KTSC domain
VARHSVQLSSSFLSNVRYDTDTQVLDVGFLNGRTYTFHGVPQNVFEGLRDARSPGQYFQQEIKGRYT